MVWLAVLLTTDCEGAGLQGVFHGSGPRTLYTSVLCRSLPVSKSGLLAGLFVPNTKSCLSAYRYASVCCIWHTHKAGLPRQVEDWRVH